jgi:hypothetical protein
MPTQTYNDLINHSYANKRLARLMKQPPTIRIGSRCRVIAEDTGWAAPVGTIVQVLLADDQYAHCYDPKNETKDEYGTRVQYVQKLSTLRLIKDAHYKAHNR